MDQNGGIMETCCRKHGLELRDFWSNKRCGVIHGCPECEYGTYKYAKLIGENRIEVLTPKPYIVEARDDFRNQLYDLNQSVMFLYDCLRLLGISKKEAIEKDYTLNINTKEKLMSRARYPKKIISNEMCNKIFREHEW